MAIKKEVKLNYCTMQLSEKCKKREGMLPVGDFYSTISELYKSGRFGICKHCLKEYVTERNGDINLSRLKTIFRVYDVPFYKREWESALKDSKDTIGTYFKNIYLNHKDKSWIDGDFDERSIVKMNTLEVADDELYARWGTSWSVSDLETLEANYTNWLTHHDCDKLTTQKLVQLICMKEMEIRKARENGESHDKIMKMEKSLIDLMDTSKLTPKTMDENSGVNSTKAFGVWIKDIEQNRPCEYFKDKSIYKDYDNILDYWNRFILRPMKNLLCGTREFDREFQSIEFDDEEVEDGQEVK